MKQKKSCKNKQISFLLRIFTSGSHNLALKDDRDSETRSLGSEKTESSNMLPNISIRNSLFWSVTHTITSKNNAFGKRFRHENVRRHTEEAMDMLCFCFFSRYLANLCAPLQKPCIIIVRNYTLLYHTIATKYHR